MRHRARGGQRAGLFRGNGRPGDGAERNRVLGLISPAAERSPEARRPLIPIECRQPMSFPQIFLGDDSDPTTMAAGARHAVGVARPDRATLESHLARRCYGRFTLTDAVRPGWQLDVVPQSGYRFDAYVDPRTGSQLPAIIASVSSERLFDTFLELIEPLGDTVDVVVEASHDGQPGDHRPARGEFNREGVERLVLESMVWDFEDLLLHDGCSSIAIMHPDLPIEVQLDEHKLLIVYATDREPFEQILVRQGIGRNDRMRFISQGEHLHTSHTRYARRFMQLVSALGAD